MRFGALAIGLIAGALVIWAGRPPTSLPPRRAPPPGEVRWLKGQLHAHSSGSGDSTTDPEEVARWYAERGYDFVVITDHNRITRVTGREDLLVIPGVELTVNLRQCSPPPEPGLACLLHVNGLALAQAAPFERGTFPPETDDRAEIYGHSIALTRQMGGVAQLNHANMHYGASAELIARLVPRGLRLMEIANVSGDSNNAGDAHHPGIEAVWDQVLSSGALIYGTATDDAHHYWDAAEARERGAEVFEGGRASVRVRARNDPGSIRAALEAGAFYASTGVVLDEVEVREGVLRIVSASPDVTTTFIGTGGAVLNTVMGPVAEHRLADGPAGYVRARVTDAGGRSAWVQPVRVGALSVP